MDESSMMIALAVLELRELNKMLEELFYSKFNVVCPDCGSIMVALVGTTNKRVKYVCRSCGRAFQKSKEKLERQVEEVEEVEEVVP